MVKRRKQLDKKINFAIANDLIIGDSESIKDLTFNDALALSPNLNEDYIYENDIFLNKKFFAIHPNRFPEYFIDQCLNKHFDFNALLDATMYQNVSTAFVENAIADFFSSEENDDYYYKFLDTAARYANLSEEFIDKYILIDTEISIFDIEVEVYMNQKLSEDFIRKHLGPYEVDEEGFVNDRVQSDYTALFANPHVKISQDYFIENNLIELNLAECILYPANHEGYVIDLSDYDFDLLCAIFSKTCEDNYMDFDEYEITPMFRAFGYDFMMRIIREGRLGAIPFDKLYPCETYPLDCFFTDLFESFVLTDEDIQILNSSINKFIEFVYSYKNENGEYNEYDSRILLCLHNASLTQKVSPAFLNAYIRNMADNECSEEFIMESCNYLGNNPYLTKEHLDEIEDYIDIDEFVKNYEFDGDMIYSVGVKNIGLLDISNESKIRYIKFIVSVDSLSRSEKVEVLMDTLFYNNLKLNDDDIKDIVECGSEAMFFKKRLACALIAFGNLNMDQIMKLKYIFE